jgi:hypothetical protein
VQLEDDGGHALKITGPHYGKILWPDMEKVKKWLFGKYFKVF